jgi:hypothetical protein
MKLFRTLFPGVCLGTFLLSCTGSNESHIISFNCGPQADTNIAILSGHVMEVKALPDGHDTLIPVSDATISLKKDMPLATVDSSGAFRIYLPTKAAHTLTISKAGYQSLKVDGFFAEVETMAEIRVALAKGNREHTDRVTACKIAY